MRDLNDFQASSVSAVERDCWRVISRVVLCSGVMILEDVGGGDGGDAVCWGFKEKREGCRKEYRDGVSPVAVVVVVVEKGLVCGGRRREKALRLHILVFIFWFK